MAKKTKLGEDENIKPFRRSPDSICYWDHESQTFYLDRGFSSTTMTLNRSEAKSLRNVLDRFLKETE